MDLDYPLIEGVCKNDIKRLQRRLNEIALWMCDVLVRNNIPHTIIFGTLLGAVRHGDWIPWDTDFDLAVPDEAYDEAVRILKENCPSKYIVHDAAIDPLYCSSWVRIVDDRSEVSSSKYLNENNLRYRGGHVDLYRLTRVKRKNYPEYLYFENVRYFEKAFKVGLISSDRYEKGMKNARDSFEKNKGIYMGEDECLAFLHLQVTKSDNFFPTKLIKFGNYFFPSPNHPHHVLRDCYYGDSYMTVPPYENRDIKFDMIKIWE